MKAVIMAGGEGTRLRPLTSNQPKPMVPVCNRPLMEHIVLLLRKHGFEEIVVTVQFLASLVRTYFGDGSEYGVSLAYATEESPLGTAGSVKNAQGALTETFLVISGDALTDIDLGEAVAFHRKRGALATVVLSRQENPLEYGIVIADEDGRIERFLEKPGWGQVFSDTVNTGIYVLEPEIFELIPEGVSVDFSKDVFPVLLERGDPVYGWVAPGYWTDVGTSNAYLRAQKDALDRAVDIDMPGTEISPGVWVEEGAVIDPGARIRGPVLIGEHAKLEAGAEIREYTVLGKNTVVKQDAFLDRATVHDNAYIGPGANLRGCILGRNADVRRGARIDEGVVVGDEGFIGEGAVLQPDVKVFPFKMVEAGAVIARSIVWESRGARSLFGTRGISGLINVDITPEFSVRLAMAYASSLKPGSTVVTSRDASRAARVVKRAIIAGLNGAAVNVHDLEVAPSPVTRFHVRSQRSQGGLSVETMPGDSQSLVIRFFDQMGADIDEGAQRSIERIFHREDVRRAFPDEIGELRFPPRALAFYQAGLLQALDLDAIRAAHFKAVVDCGFGATALVLPGILGRLGSDVITVNAYVDESRPTTTEEERAAQLAQLADVVRGPRASIGALIDTAGERLELVAEGGMPLPRDRALLVLTDLVCEVWPGRPIVVPVSVTGEIERIAARAGSPVVRTKLAASAIMSSAAESEAVFAADGDGAYIFADFLPAFDGLAAFCKVLELLSTTGASIGERAASLPETPMVHRTVATPWERKGSVMRRVAQAHDGERTQEIEGLKVYHGDEWALVVPDPEHPITHVWTEGESVEAATQWADRYVGFVEEAIE